MALPQKEMLLDSWLVRLPLFSGLHSQPIMRFSYPSAGPRTRASQTPLDRHGPASGAGLASLKNSTQANKIAPSTSPSRAPFASFPSTPKTYKDRFNLDIAFSTQKSDLHSGVERPEWQVEGPRI